MDSGAEQWDDVHERVLRFMGAFSSVQFAIDTQLEFHLKRQMPKLGPVIREQFLNRVRDDQRMPLFEAFADEIDYSGDLTSARIVYNRAKQVRDFIGHSLGVVGPAYRVGGPASIGVTHLQGKRGPLVPAELFPSTFDRLTADCEWLAAHATRAGWVGKVADFIDMAGEPWVPEVPPALPDGGEPLP